jgi:signal transduction histidine kinase
MVGVICAEHRGGPRLWREDEQSYVGNLADLFARALIADERLQAQRELEQLNGELERRVEERTRSLQETLERLEAAHGQLLEREKLAALGALVAGVTHEVNTPVGIALTAASHGRKTLGTLVDALAAGSLSRNGLEQGLAELGEGFGLVEHNIARALQLLAHFKQTAADQTSEQRARFELGDCLESVLASLAPLLRQRGIRIALQSQGYVTMDSYPGAIAQIIANLVNNAALHAFADQVADKCITLRFEGEGDEVVMQVEDNGRGMDAATQAQAMEPFFTTARGRGGTGLGLSIVSTLVAQPLGGRMRLHSSPGAGTRFVFYLPLVAPVG